MGPTGSTLLVTSDSGASWMACGSPDGLPGVSGALYSSGDFRGLYGLPAASSPDLGASTGAPYVYRYLPQRLAVSCCIR